jgi:competence protein ComGC
MFRVDYKTEFVPFGYKKDYNILDILRNTKITIQDSKRYNKYMTSYNKKINELRNLNETLTFPKANNTLGTLGTISYAQTLTIPDEAGLKIYKELDPDYKPKKMKSLYSAFNKYNNNPISIFYTQSDIFNDLNYSNLVYDFNKIYKKGEDYYVKMIKDRLEEFKSNRNENFTSLLERRYMVVEKESIGYKEPIERVITMYSLEIKFNDITNTDSTPVYTYLPFALLPLYYYVDIETFKLLLMAILKFNESFTEITIDENALYEILNSWRDYETDKEAVTLSSSNLHRFYWLTNKCIFEVYIK